MSEAEYDLIIVGGGAAGLLAGVVAVQAGLRVLIVERLKQPGRRLLATGGGRCNLSRDLKCSELLQGYYKSKNFVRTAIYAFPTDELREFFARIGLETTVDPGGGVYPASQRASDVLRVLESAYLQDGGRFLLETEVNSVRVSDGHVCRVEAAGENYTAECVLLCGGGCSMQELGANGSGFTLARSLGHRIVQPVAGLAGLVIPELADSSLAGLALPVIIRHGTGKRVEVFEGDALFTHKGLSGPAVLNVSRLICRDIAEGRAGEIRLDWGGYSIEFWQEQIERIRRKDGCRTVFSLVAEYLPRRLAGYVCNCAGVDQGVILAEFKKEHIRSMLAQLAGRRYEVTRSEGFSRSMVTSGGVDTAEVDPKTMASRLVGGLYFAGEVLDVDGECGGYNLHWAFASARLAADSVHRYYEKE